MKTALFRAVPITSNSHVSHGGGRPQDSRNKSKGHDRQAGAIKVAVSTRIGGGFFNSMQAEGNQKFKMEVGKIYRLMFDPDDDRREVDASEIAMKGKIFQALVVDYKMSQGEVEWKGAPADLLRGVKDRKQVIGLSDFEADYVLLRQR